MSEDSRWPSEVTRRRVLGGVMTIGAASAAAGAGTAALFEDSETSSENTISAGTIDLAVGGTESNAVVRLPNLKPGDSGQESTTIRNTGTLTGYFRFGIEGFRTPENGVNEPESTAAAESDPLGPDSGSVHSGELGQNLSIRMKLVHEGSDVFLVGSSSSFVEASKIRLGPRDLSNLRLSAGENVEFVTEYELPSGVTNEVQSDSVEIHLDFGLVQETGQSVLAGAEEVAARAVGPSGGNSGVEFTWTNDLGEEATITDVHVQPADTDLVLLSDQEGGTNYDDFTYNADLHIEAPSGDQDGYVDGGSSQFEVPGWLDLNADGWAQDGSADQHAILSAGSEATVNLYAFRDETGSKVDMTGRTVRVTFDVRLADGTREYVPIVMTPE